MSSGDRKFQPRAYRSSGKRDLLRIGIFMKPLNTNDRFFFSYINSKISDRTVRYSLISVGDVTEVDVYSRQINLKQQINSALNNEQNVISPKLIYKN